MAKSSVYNLSILDDRSDELLFGRKVLEDKITELAVKKRLKGEVDTTPAIDDIMKTHKLYVGSITKPFVKTASEYYKVNPTGGSLSLSATSTTRIEFVLPTFGQFTSDMALRIRISALDGLGATNYKYCAYPGIRIKNKATFKSDGKTIDEYETDWYLNWMKTRVDATNSTAWDRLLGQQEIKRATYNNTNGYTQHFYYSDGAQTLSGAQDQLELIIPMGFWMNRNVGDALVNEETKRLSQRTIEIELSRADALLIAQNNVGAAVSIPSRIPFEADLYVNNISIDPGVFALIEHRFKNGSPKMVRLHRFPVRKTLTSSSDYVELKNITNMPIEDLCVMARSPANKADIDIWHLGGYKRPRVNANRIIGGAFEWNSGLGVVDFNQKEAKEATTLEPAIDTLALKREGIELYRIFPAQFYSAYLQNRYKDDRTPTIRVPYDQSVYNLPFSLLQGTEEPSGVLNSTKDRIQLELTGSTISRDNPIEVIVLATAISYLKVYGDSVDLKYIV